MGFPKKIRKTLVFLTKWKEVNVTRKTCQSYEGRGYEISLRNHCKFIFSVDGLGISLPYSIYNFSNFCRKTVNIVALFSIGGLPLLQNLLFTKVLDHTFH